jgi:hypothetical protein
LDPILKYPRRKSEEGFDLLVDLVELKEAVR